MHRRAFLAASAAAVALAGVARAAGPELEVAKTPWCGCCTDWVAHMEAAGFETRVVEVGQEDLNQVKAGLGIAPEHASCHTARIGGYVLEGHVPAEDVARLLSERPKALGLAVPGMPAGSPGMEMGDAKDPYEVLLVTAPGEAQVFSRR